MSDPRGALHRTRRHALFTAQLVNTAAKGEQPHVADDMRAAILAGDEPPGTVIPIDAVAQFFGVSKIPVREALKVLQGEGLVEHVSHVGYSVAKVTFDEFRELYEVRLALEIAALPVAVRAAGPDDEGRVRVAHAAMSVDDGRAYSSASRDFHLALIRPSQMFRLLSMYEAAWNMTESAQPMTRVPPVRRGELHEDHDRLLAAFVARDAATLIRLTNEHYAHLKSAIGSFRDDPTVFRQAPG